MNLTLEQKSTAIHGIGGVLIGIISGVMTKDPYQIGNGGVLLFMLGILAILYFITQRFFKLRSIETAEQKKLDNEFTAKQTVFLDPFEKDHALILCEKK